MAKKKRYRGHYCKVCNSILANEKFSGKGHSNHICKKCSKLPLEERNEQMVLNRIYGLYRYSYLSKVNKLKLQNYLKSGSEKVRSAAKEMLDEFTEIARLIRMDKESYEKEHGIDPGNDEFLEDDDYFSDLHELEGEGEFDFDGDGDGDELPF
jgi:hypothetical protein